jgi:hypothetical protein
VETLPDDFAIALGRILFLGGRVEMLLDRLLAPAGEQPSRRGLSGAQLVKELRKVASPGGRLSEIVDGYEAMHEWRNHLVHGSHNYAGDVLWTWREQTKAKGNAAFSFQFTLDTLQGVAQSWQNLADAAHDELHARTRTATG